MAPLPNEKRIISPIDMEAPQKPKMQTVSAEELKTMMGPSAVYVNHFYATPVENMVRITAAEKSAPNPGTGEEIKIPRFTMVLGPTGLVGLAGLMNTIVSQMNAAQQQSVLQQQPAPSKEELN